MTQHHQHKAEYAPESLSFRWRVLSYLAAFADDVGVPYAILGDEHRLTNRPGGDVDIVVAQEALDSFARRFSRYVAPRGIQVVQAYSTYHNSVFLVLEGRDGSGRPLFAELDVTGDIHRYGRHLIDARELLADRRTTTVAGSAPFPFFIPAPAAAFIHSLLKRIDKGELDEERARHLTELWLQDPLGCEKHVRRFWPDAEAALILRGVTGRWDRVRAELPRLRRLLDARNRFDWRPYLRVLRCKLHRLLQPTGFCVVLLGPDGSGKTSLAKRLQCDLAPAFSDTAFRYRRPGLYPGRKRRTPSTGDPHDKPERGLLWSLAKLATLLFDCSIGYACKVSPLRARGELVIFDRYFHDILADPKRYPYNGPLWLARMAASMLPLPDLYVFMDASPAVVQARKQEVPLDETIRQLSAYRAVAAMLPNSHIVQTSQPFDTVVREVESLMLSQLAERAARRMNDLWPPFMPTITRRAETSTVSGAAAAG